MKDGFTAILIFGMGVAPLSLAVPLVDYFESNVGSPGVMGGVFILAMMVLNVFYEKWVLRQPWLVRLVKKHNGLS